jgi:hypothetical protein
MKRILLLIGIAASALFPLGAQTLVVTSLTAALGQTDGDIPVASITGLSVGATGYVDQELFRITGIAGKTLRTARGVGGVQSAHISGSLVYFGEFHTKDPVGACSDPATSTWLNTTNGEKFQCSGGKWTKAPILRRDILTPSMAPPSGHTFDYTKGGKICALSPLGVETCTGEGSGGTSITDFTTTRVSGTVVSVSAGTFRYGTNVQPVGAVSYTLQQIPITSIVTGVNTRINTATSLANVFVSGNTVNVQLVGCPAGTGVFVGSWDYSLPNGLTIAADTSGGGCSFTSGLIGAQTGGSAIIFGNSAGQLEMSHSAAMGAIVTTTDPGATVTQTATGIFPNGSIPIASVDISAGAFSAVTDKRAFLSNQEIQSGAGIDVTMVGGQVQVATGSNIPKTDAPSVWLSSVDMQNATKTYPWRSGAGSPSARDNCATKGEAYFMTDGPSLWVCTVTGSPGTWASVGSLGGGTVSNAMTWNSVVMTWNGTVMTWN